MFIVNFISEVKLNPNKIKLGQLCYPANMKFDWKYDRPFRIGWLVDLKETGFPAGVLDGEVWLPDAEKKKVDISNINWPENGIIEVEYPQLIKYKGLDWGLKLLSYPGYIAKYQEALWYAENDEYKYIDVARIGAKHVHPKRLTNGHFIGNYSSHFSLPDWEIERNFIPLRQSKFYKSDGLYVRNEDEKKFYSMWQFQSTGTVAMAFPEEFPTTVDIKSVVDELPWKSLNEDAEKWAESLPDESNDIFKRVFQLGELHNIPLMIRIKVDRFLGFFQETIAITTYTPDYKTGYELIFRPEVNGHKNSWQKKSYQHPVQNIELSTKEKYSFTDADNPWCGSLHPHWNDTDPIVFLSGDFENIEVLKSDLSKHFKKGVI